MMKTLPHETQLDVDQAFMGKLWAYVAVVTGAGSALGVAVANERGYSPIPLTRYRVDRHDDAEAEADRLNASRGISRRAATDIVASSMAAQNRAKQGAGP